MRASGNGPACARGIALRRDQRARVVARAESPVSPEELAEIAARDDMGESELAALDAVFAYLSDKRHDQVIGTLLKLSRLPQKSRRRSRGSTSGASAGATPRRCASCPRWRTSTRGRTSRS